MGARSLARELPSKRFWQIGRWRQWPRHRRRRCLQFRQRLWPPSGRGGRDEDQGRIRRWWWRWRWRRLRWRRRAAAVAAAVVRCRRGMRAPIRRTSSHTFSPTSGCSAGRRADAGTRSKSPSTATLSTNTFATNLPAKRGKAQGKAIARARSSDVRAPTTPVAGAPCLARGGARLPGCRRATAKGRSVVRKIP